MRSRPPFFIDFLSKVSIVEGYCCINKVLNLGSANTDIDLETSSMYYDLWKLPYINTVTDL